MKLTKGEFCQFNLKSKIRLLKEHGMMLMRRKLDTIHEIRLFLIYGFYVEVFLTSKEQLILKIEPVLNHKWVDMYLNK